MSKYTHNALSMFKIPQDGSTGTRYVLVKIPYNPETNETGEPIQVCKDIREDVIDKFKVAVDEEGFFRD